MLLTYIRLAFRHLRKHSLIAFINIMGLGVALLAYVLILQHVGYEKSYDQFHTANDRIYRVDSEFANGDDRERYAMNYYGLAEAMQADFPEVEAYTTLHPGELVIETATDNYHEGDIYLVDSNFAEFFSFPLVSGDVSTALDEPASAILSAHAAEKYFGQQDPVGQVLRYNGGKELNVKAVVEIPENSHINFNIVANGRNYVNRRYREQDAIWDWSNFYVYVRLQEGAMATKTADKFPQLIAKYLPDDDEETAFFLVPLADIHLQSNLG
ncbi:MAG: ABC transporter permease, partial [Bacteroidota bacterium]